MTKPVIVVIENAPEFLDLMHDVLTEYGYQPVTWSVSDGAFEMILQEQPDLVILDVRLEHPKAGQMVLGLMRLDPVTKRIPVIVCTTDPRLLEQSAAFAHDPHCAVLVKPLDFGELHATIEKMLAPIQLEEEKG